MDHQVLLKHHQFVRGEHEDDGGGEAPGLGVSRGGAVSDTGATGAGGGIEASDDKYTEWAARPQQGRQDFHHP